MADDVVKKTGRPKGKKSGYTVSEKALAQRRGNAALPIAQTDEEFDYNSRLIAHVMEVQKIAAQADRHDLLSLRSCFIAYLKLCQQDGFTVGNMGAYMAMGMTTQDFATFIKRQDPEIREFGKWVKQTCALFRESRVAEGKLNPVIGIFWQRNYDGLRNDTEQVQAMQEQEENDAQFGGSSYKDRYRNLIGGSGSKE